MNDVRGTYHRYGMLLCAIILMISGGRLQGFSTLAKNDPYPLFSTTYPYSYLLDSTKNYLKGIVDNSSCNCDCDCNTNCDRGCDSSCDSACPPYKRDYFSIAFSGIYQKANRGSNYDRQKDLPLGELENVWGILPMLYGIPNPGPGALPTQIGNQLVAAKQALFPAVTPPTTTPVPDNLIVVDDNELVGFASAPIRYRKHGIRFESALQPHEDIGLLIQGGYADIKQTLTVLTNLGKSATASGCGLTDPFIATVNCILMTHSAYTAIFKQQFLDDCTNTQNVCDFRKGSFEDLRFSVWLRHIFQANCGRECDWPAFLFTPFLFFEAALGLSVDQDFTKLLSLPFGNNRHNSLGFTAGFTIDFIDTIEIGFHGGITHFTGRDLKNYRLPTHPTQSGIFPFATDIHLKPGSNHHFACSMHAYRFLGKMSAWVEFEYMNHAQDSITILDEGLRTADPAIFIPCQRECMSKFTALFLTTVLNYEISPNFMLGFGVQWPLQQRNSYRSTTVLGTLRATF